MSFADYGALKTAVATWLGRSDQSTQIVDCITMTHDKLMRVLRTREMETVDAGVTVSAETKALPSTWLETRKIYVTSASPRVDLQYVSFDKLADLNRNNDTGVPRYFTVVGGNMQFAPIPDATYVLSHFYYVREAQMSATADTNWVLQNHPDLYLYGALLESASLIQDDGRVPFWQDRYDRALAEVIRNSNRARSGPSMMVRPG